jgi:ribosomal protein S18 acetylase RimI-like enzyme
MPAIPASESDILTIQQLAQSIWLAHYIPIIGEAQTVYMLDKMYSAPALKQQMESGLQFYLWYEEALPVGFAVVDVTNYDHGFLSKLYLDEKYRGKGIAGQFLQFLERQFGSAEKKEIQLTVNRQNIGAINFYFKAGFKIIRCADFDIGSDYLMNDFVMSKKLG